MAAGAPTREIREFEKREAERQSRLMQNRKIKKYTHTCAKCGADSFSKRYNYADNVMDEHLICRCNDCEYLWRMNTRDKEN